MRDDQRQTLLVDPERGGVIVYLYVHLPSEMGYVGSTERSLEERFEAHWKDARKKRRGALHAFMSQPDRSKADWLRVTLEEYDDLESMLRGEVEWMLELETFRPNVGFNSQIPSEQDIQTRLSAPPQRKRVDMTSEELEFYREQGVMGAATVSEDDAIARGKIGASVRWSKQDRNGGV